MEIRKDGHIVWEKVDRSHKRDTFEKIAGLDAICFNGKAYERLTADTHIYGDIYALKVNGSAVGYAIYGQVWLPELPDAYISRIGVHPDYRQLGYGLKILEAILSDLSNRPECLAVYGDIRKSNIASQKLFRKAGFHVHCEWDGLYTDEVAIRVMKTLSKEKVDEKPNGRSRIRTCASGESRSTSRQEESTGNRSRLATYTDSDRRRESDYAAGACESQFAR